MLSDSASSSSAEERMLRRALTGDKDAFNTLIEQYQAHLFTMAVRLLGDEATAADTLQDAILAAWQHRDQFHSGSFRAWLIRILINHCYDVLRWSKGHPTTSLDIYSEKNDSSCSISPIGNVGTPESSIEQAELTEYLLWGLRCLPLDQRTVIVLSDIQGYHYQEIAEILELELGTVKSRLSRARTQLRNWLVAHPELLPLRYRSLYAKGREPS
jgi:RNA polymerase sigma-70 factor (ECF subfamily)